MISVSKKKKKAFFFSFPSWKYIKGWKEVQYIHLLAGTGNKCYNQMKSHSALSTNFSPWQSATKLRTKDQKNQTVGVEIRTHKEKKDRCCNHHYKAVVILTKMST